MTRWSLISEYGLFRAPPLPPAAYALLHYIFWQLYPCCSSPVSALCLTSRPFATSEKSAVSFTKPDDAGLMPAAAIHVGRTPGVDASKAAGSVGDSVAADGTDEAILSEAVAQFYTDEKQDSSGPVKVFSHLSSLNCLTHPYRPVHASRLIMFHQSFEWDCLFICLFST